MVFSRKTFLALVVATATTTNAVYGYRGGIRGLTTTTTATKNNIDVVNDNDHRGLQKSDKSAGEADGATAAVPVATVPDQVVTPVAEPIPDVLSAREQIVSDCQGQLNSLNRCTGLNGQDARDCHYCIFGFSSTSGNNANACRYTCDATDAQCDTQIANTLSCARGDVVELPPAPPLVVTLPAPDDGNPIPGIDNPIIEPVPVPVPEPPAVVGYEQLTTSSNCPLNVDDVFPGASCEGLIPAPYQYHNCVYADRICSCRSDAPQYMCQMVDSGVMPPPPPPIDPGFSVDPIAPPVDVAFGVDPIPPPGGVGDPFGPASEGFDVQPNPAGGDPGAGGFPVESICSETSPINESGCGYPGLNCGPFYAVAGETSLADATQCVCQIDRWVCGPFVGGIGEVSDGDDNFPGTAVITDPSTGIIEDTPSDGSYAIPATVDFSNGSDWCPQTIVNCSPCRDSLPEQDFLEGSCAQILEVPYENQMVTVELQCRCALQEIADPVWNCRFIGGSNGSILVPVSPICNAPDYIGPSGEDFMVEEPGFQVGGPDPMPPFAGGPSDEELQVGEPEFQVGGPDPMPPFAEPPADQGFGVAPPPGGQDPFGPAAEGIDVPPGGEMEIFPGEPGADFVVESICGETSPINGSGCGYPGLNCGPFFAVAGETSLADATQCACETDIWVCGPFVGGIGVVTSDDQVSMSLPETTLAEPSPAVIQDTPVVITSVGGLSTDTCVTQMPTTLGLAATRCALPPDQICCYGVQLARATICACTGNLNGRTYECRAGAPSDCPDNQNPNVITAPPSANRK